MSQVVLLHALRQAAVWLTYDVGQKPIANVSPPKFWPVPVSIFVALATFAGTYYAYAERHRLQEEGSPIPGIIGLVLFVVAMVYLTDQLLPEKRKNRSLVLASVVAAEAIAFFFIFMLLLLNTFGS